MEFYNKTSPFIKKPTILCEYIVILLNGEVKFNFCDN